MGSEVEAVWRVCEVIRGDCQHCPATEERGGDTCVRGCFAQATECINVVETGNPWRKTEGVDGRWTVLSKLHQDAGNGELVCAGCEGRPAPGNNPCAVCGRSADALVGDGWVLVPKHPTPAMKEAAGRVWGFDCAHDAWVLMLAAAPAHGGGG